MMAGVETLDVETLQVETLQVETLQVEASETSTTTDTSESPLSAMFHLLLLSLTANALFDSDT
jgi:hypothetical protein